jgi:ATP-dependent helicase/nuclease subunit B
MLSCSLDGKIIITPNRRLAGFISDNLAQRKERYQVQPINDFVKEIYYQHIGSSLIPKMFISSTQQHILIQKIIENSIHNSGLLKSSSTADKVLQAIKFIKSWRIPVTEFSSYMNNDTEVFIDWYEDYISALEKLELIDEEDIIESSSLAIFDNNIFWFNEIILFGFNEIAPLLQMLIDSFAKSGICNQQLYATHEINNWHLELNTQENEWDHAARWAKYHSDNSDDSIAVVVPDLATYRREVANIMHKYFAAEKINISAPQSLSSYPLVKDALSSIQLILDTIAFSDLSYWLRHCHNIKDAYSTKASKAKFEKELRGFCQGVIKKQTLIDYIDDYLQKEDEGWLQSLHLVLTKNRFFGEKHSVIEWVEIFKTVLVDLGWPDGVKNSKKNADILACWNLALIEYKSLNQIIGLSSLDAAIEKLKYVVANIPFLPETDNAKVHVLGLLEASGVPFDRIWVTGMSEGVWPQEPDPNPFIPSIIQKKYNLPRSTSIREYSVALQITDSFKQTPKKEAIFSYARTIKELEVRGSKLITDINKMTVNELNLVKICTDIITVEVQKYTDDKGIRLATKNIRQGVQILQDQAWCSFRGYARHRLLCNKIEDLNYGVSAKEHGQLLHNVLADIWEHLKNQQQLLQLSKEAQLKIVQVTVDKWLQEFIQKNNNSMLNSLIEFERARLVENINHWISFERKRSEFSVVAIEKKKKVNLSDLSFNIRLDRIDKGVDGSYTIIDYKTGTVDPHGWFGNRIREPQLPIYALISEEQNVGVVVASFKNANYEFKGIVTNKDLYPGAKEVEYFNNKIKGECNWDSLKEQWKDKLEIIAKEYTSAEAKINPVNGEATCRICELRLLCRRDVCYANID